MRKELFENYKESLKQKYNAVCFDIDGTLTEKDSEKIDEKILEMLVDLLSRKIPIVFITGRGESGLEDLKRDIFDSLTESALLTDEDLKRIYVLTNDGARMFYSKSISSESFLKDNAYISTFEELQQLIKINEVVLKLKQDLQYNSFFDIGYSEDKTNNIILNIRLKFNTNNDDIINTIFDSIKELIDKEYTGIHITRGVYKNQPVIQIGTAKKNLAIERAEKMIGVPKDSMIRIGDCGDLRGNDYAMLNCNQGYSVDKTSGELNSCFPIFDDAGRILKGTTATLQLVKTAKILPTVCLEKAEEADYTCNFAKVEKEIVNGRKKLLSRFNDIINDNFNDKNGINSIFDKQSGSIKIPMYEWYLLKNSPLKDFWETKSNGNLKYSIRDDNDYLLRGSSTYYYFLANRKSENGIDITTKNDVIEWYNNYLDFFENANDAISHTENINSIINKKLLLGILDNCRNVLLVLMNNALMSNCGSSNVLLEVSPYNQILADESRVLLTIEKQMKDMCFEKNYLISKDLIQESVKDIINIIKKNYNKELLSEEKSNYSKDYRTYREIDNFGENYVAVSLYGEKSQNRSDAKNSCGLSYGGIELPFISKIIEQDRVEKMLLLKYNKMVSGYTNKQLLELRKFNIEEYGGLNGAKELANSNITLFDDNVLTGKTLQIAINSLYDYGIKVDDICIVRYPSVNRINQMFFNNTTAVDHRLFFNYIHGLCFSSPYSWKDNEWIDSNGKVDYTDSLGTFDLNREKILKCLLKNHDYKEYSEVGEYKRRLVKCK